MLVLGKWSVLFVKWSVNKGVLGSAQVDTTTTLVAMVDDATSRLGCTFNHAVMRKALKSLVNQDVQVSAWENLTNVTKKTLDARFIPDSNSKDVVDADDFYIILLTQTFQKLTKLASNKLKHKDLCQVNIEHIFQCS